MRDNKLHSFARTVAHVELPPRFTFPFCYTPHPLCIEAADIVKSYLASRTDWAAELQKGKMLGVLIVEDNNKNIGFLAAFSGNLAHSNQHTFFVPPVYDLLNPDGEFCRGEAEISAINSTIAKLESSEQLSALQSKYTSEVANIEAELENFRAEMKAEKEARDSARLAGITAEEERAMIARSQFMKAEFKRRKKSAAEAIANLDSGKELATLTAEINNLKTLRKQKSALLQKRLFELFVISNANGGSSDLVEIFRPTSQGVPPAGAGECAAPKLLQYAYTHGMTPRAMAEFWWGDSPIGEIRHHGNFYPSCRSKCLPILTFMMQGLSVDENPLASTTDSQLTVVYNDEWLTVVDKPSGMLTVPGKDCDQSLQSKFMEMFPDAEGPLIVHRLDMGTSGLVVVAKNKDVHKNLQAQFATRCVEKHYEALLDGSIDCPSGIIDLPMRPNPDDRPRQIVDNDGKPAVTSYQLIECIDGISRIEFHPHTGRTHQLRVHSAHPQGLNAPIIGDSLYGKNNEGTTDGKYHRLCLHAKYLKFQHPVTSQIIEVKSKVPF